MSNLQEFYHAEEAQNSSSKMIVAVIIALVMAGFGIYVYESGMWNPQPTQVVDDGSLPKP